MRVKSIKSGSDFIENETQKHIAGHLQMDSSHQRLNLRHSIIANLITSKSVYSSSPSFFIYEDNIRMVIAKQPIDGIDPDFISSIHYVFIINRVSSASYRVRSINTFVELFHNMISIHGFKSIEPHYTTTYIIDIDRGVLIADKTSFVTLMSATVTTIRLMIVDTSNLDVLESALRICLEEAYTLPQKVYLTYICIDSTRDTEFLERLDVLDVQTCTIENKVIAALDPSDLAHLVTTQAGSYVGETIETSFWAWGRWVMIILGTGLGAVCTLKMISRFRRG